MLGLHVSRVIGDAAQIYTYSWGIAALLQDGPFDACGQTWDDQYARNPEV